MRQTTITPDELMLFVGRKNTFAIQTDKGAYIPKRRNITTKDLQDHLDGKVTLGSYVIREDGLITFACIDIDTTPGNNLEPYKRLAELIFDLFPDFQAVLEFSGRRGYHIWLFPEKPEQPKFMRELIKSRLKMYGIRNIEIYPKQDTVNELKKQLGNLVKIPAGRHKKGGWSEIMRWRK